MAPRGVSKAEKRNIIMSFLTESKSEPWQQAAMF
jgi:hypothetical protein